MAEHDSGVDSERQALLEHLHRHRVEGIVIGGVAIQTHRPAYRTDDVDFAPATDPANLRRLAAALNALDLELVVSRRAPRTTVALPSEFMKKRTHEALIADFGTWCIARGFEADRDLVLRREGTEWLVEAKVVYLGNATDAVRAALAQLLMYSYFLGGTPPPRLLALFSESVGDAFVSFLESHAVASVWAADEGWGASESARGFLRAASSP